MKTLGLFNKPVLRVYNKKDPNAQGLWVDRETEFGNMFHIGEDGNRKEVINKFEARLIEDYDLSGKLYRLRGHSLICHCKPKMCHGDVLLKYANGFWLCVTGGRNYDNKKVIRRNLEKVNDENEIKLLIEGEATGADILCRRWAVKNKIPTARVKPDWKRLGDKAGMKRNTEMLKTYKPNLLLAFPGGVGTEHCVREAKRLGIAIRYAEGA